MVTMSFLGNILFLIFGGVLAAFFALTIVGYPLATQHIKLLPLSLLPFGLKMLDIETGQTYP